MEDEGIFVVAVGTDLEGPLIWEAEGFQTSREAAITRMREQSKKGHRSVAVFRLTYEAGNPLLERDLKDAQRLGPAKIS